ncbi:EGF-like repeat and discoidin I-like domain-containing 3 [Paramuricea clavata]|uniref:EGF-like repeat and discoidin I-like domain-containing 3 n=1 Tax=Paramuricea clavata TaxID=317549 RepID=A0A7D9I2V5_PARCT|nr:EGF-like repeat and discoidin I-like domain-containing 3 [Paramuricea clavata]
MATLGEAICCESIKSLAEEKSEAIKTLCGAGSTLSPQCCRDIANEVRRYVDAYEALCLNKNPKPLGMTSGKIPDNAITASSYYGKYNYPYYARLTKTGSLCSWTPTAAGRVGSWLQVDLGQLTTVTGIATQGTCYNYNNWAKSYSVSYSNEPNSWTLYEESGNVKVSQRINLVW